MFVVKIKKLTVQYFYFVYRNKNTDHTVSKYMIYFIPSSAGKYRLKYVCVIFNVIGNIYKNVTVLKSVRRLSG